MTKRADIAKGAAKGLRQFARTIDDTPVLIGFDGFVDSIIRVVDSRDGVDDYTAVPTIAKLGKRISAAAGKSSNFELVTTLQKLGGNGPIMANAMARAGLPVTYIGAVGYPKVHEVFEPMAEIAEVHAIAEPGLTDALEFDDGKLMLGKYDHLLRIEVDTIRKSVGLAAFADWVGRSVLIGMINWVMMPGTESIWRHMIDEVLPSAPPHAGGRRRLIFVDLCDPAKRTPDDLKRAMKLCTELDRHADVVFGMNLNESLQVARVLGLSFTGDTEAQIEQIAREIRDALEITCAVVHPRSGAAAALKSAGRVTSAAFAGPFVHKPRLSTGAGDNFNAGFCLGLLAGLPVEQCLATGTGTSGYYVREAGSPTLKELAAFLDDLPAPES